MIDNAFTLTPAQIVAELDKYIIGQDEAKRAVAIAMRNRWRRQQLGDDLRYEVTPKNILMIGPTGVGKTEISRRLAALAGAPFLKVEATKFTEVGYVGRDVESIIRDLADKAVKMQRELATQEVKEKAEHAAEERILDLLLPTKQKKSDSDDDDELSSELDDSTAENYLLSDDKKNPSKQESAARKMFRKKLRSGKLDDKEIEIDLQARNARMEIMGPAGMEEMTSQLQNMLEGIGSAKRKKQLMTVKDALAAAVEEEAAKLVNEDDIKSRAIKNVEQNGIVFIDEIDKVARRSESGGGNGDVSREGVQRDLLPLVEGCTVSTKYGTLKTDHILFIASGAFHMVKPSDLVPELQGRLPIRVELKALTANDFKRILTEPNSSLTKQYTGLMETEGVKLSFTKDGIKQIADIAFQVNDRSENIGARRLYTILERLLESLSYEASEMSGKKISINGKYVKEQLSACIEDEDLSRWVL